MKREGRRHGAVRSCVIVPSSSPSLITDENSEVEPTQIINNKLGSSHPKAADLSKKVCTKPTNHGGRIKCWGGRHHHLHPVFKSKDKMKGSQKMKSTDVALNYKLLTWRVVDDGGFKKLKLNGSSASRILDDLACDSTSFYDDDDDDHDSGNYEGYDDHDDAGGYGLGGGRNLLLMMGGDGSELIYGGGGGEAGDGIQEIGDDVIVHDGDADDSEDEDDMLGFVDVAFIWEPIDAVGEDGWSIVGEI